MAVIAGRPPKYVIPAEFGNTGDRPRDAGPVAYATLVNSG